MTDELFETHEALTSCLIVKKFNVKNHFLIT